MRLNLTFILSAILLAGFLFSGCSFVQQVKGKLPLSQLKRPEKPVSLPSLTSEPSPVFLDPLPIKQSDKSYQQPRWGLKRVMPVPALSNSASEVGTGLVNREMASSEKVFEPASLSALQLKYAAMLEQDFTSLPDPRLLAAIDPWIGVRYQRGGTSEMGIDCSAFTASVLSAYAGIRLPRTCREQFQQAEKVDKDKIQVGDLLFFRTRGRSVSHVGIYLGNNKFVHASSSNGVMVSSRNEPYFSSRFVGARRAFSAGATESAFE